MINEKKLDRIIRESVRRVLREAKAGRKLLKKIDNGEMDIWAEIEDGGGVMFVFWLRHGMPRSLTSYEWIAPVKDGIYVDHSNWDELDRALTALGAVRLGNNSVQYDDFGDVDTYVNTYYDCSAILG